MWIFTTIPFLLQAAAITFDEFYFHHKRGLPRWERIGHPVDTVSYLLCLLFLLFFPCTDWNIKVYIALVTFSCLLITKDEFVHTDHCEASENWLHALLFVMHPITLVTAGFMWQGIHAGEAPEWLIHWFDNAAALTLFLQIQAVLIALFCFYQIIYWNVLWKESTMTSMKS